MTVPCHFVPLAAPGMVSQGIRWMFNNKTPFYVKPSFKINNKIYLNRVKGIVDSVPKCFSNINFAMPEQKDIWYGFRPCTPDGLPYIGSSKKIANLLIAGGHAMSGLSLRPATGKVIAELASGQEPSVKIDAFNPGRFS